MFGVWLHNSFSSYPDDIITIILVRRCKYILFWFWFYCIVNLLQLIASKIWSRCVKSHLIELWPGDCAIGIVLHGCSSWKQKFDTDTRTEFFTLNNLHLHHLLFLDVKEWCPQNSLYLYTDTSYGSCEFKSSLSWVPLRLYVGRSGNNLWMDVGFTGFLPP